MQKAQNFNKMKRIYLSTLLGVAMIRRMAMCFTVIFTFVFTANAQFFDEISTPEVVINIQHPPILGLKVSKIAFGPATGKCSDQVVDALISDFVSNDIEVIDRENLTTILSEHDFTLSGYVNQASAATIGKIIGPSALVFVKVVRCETKQDRLYDRETKYDYQAKREYTVTAYYSRTRAFLKASIQTVDLATGRIFSAQTLDFSPEDMNKSYQGYPEAPSEFDVQDLAFRQFVRAVHRMFLPWSERTKLYFFDDKAGELKQAYQTLIAGNIKGAFTISQQNLENCRNSTNTKEKTLAHAYYNMGMCHMIQDEYDEALEHFREAQRLRPGDIVTKAIADCQKAKELMSAMQQIDEKASFEAEKIQAEEERAIEAETVSTLTNADIVELTQKNIPNSIIIHKIKHSKCNFDTSTDGLVALANAGVSEEVIIVMMEN